MYTCVRHCTYNGTFKYKIDQKWHFERSLVKPIRPLGRNIARREREKTAKTDFFLFLVDSMTGPPRGEDEKSIQSTPTT